MTCQHGAFFTTGQVNTESDHLESVALPLNSLLTTTPRTTPGEGGRINMPYHKFFPVQDIAPKAWSAMCQLLGGAERINESVSPPFRLPH